MSPPKKEAPLAWRQDRAGLGSLEPKVNAALPPCKRLEGRVADRSQASPNPLYGAIAKDARSMIVTVLELFGAPDSAELAFRLRMVGRKLKRDANRLVFHLQRQSAAAAKAWIHDRNANPWSGS
jgi:hypothetical protein